MILPPILPNNNVTPIDQEYADKLMMILKAIIAITFLLFVFGVWGCFIRDTGETNIEWLFDTTFN